MLTSPPRTPVRAAATDAPAETVVNTRKLAELERALLDAHSRPKVGDPPVHDWPPSVAVRQVKEQPTRGQPSELIEFAIAAKDLGSALAQEPTACKPIAILLLSEEPWKVLGYTEWQADTDQPAFDTVVLVDAAVLPGGPSASLYLQVRHVDDPYWDALQADAPEAMQQMRLLGRATFKMSQALEAPRAAAGSSGRLELNLYRPAGDARGGREALSGVATLRVRSAASWAPNRLVEPHASCNFLFSLTEAERAERELRVCEHLLPCAYGRAVPCAVLAMLCADAELNAEITAPPATPHGAAEPRLGELWALQDARGWAQLARWLHAQLHGAQASRASGFKPSARKKERPLAAVPANLCLNLLEVQRRGAGGTHAVYPTVSVGAAAAHPLGFTEGGAAGLAERLRQSGRDPGRRAATAELAHAYACRSAVVMAQGYATLAAAFALTCQTHAARRNRQFFVQIQRCGFLLQAESLLSTRGDDWGMLQDLHEAWGYLGQVQLMLAPEVQESAEGVQLRGGRHCPTLCFAPSELGFADARAAEELGLQSGHAVAVVAVLATQGINEEQAVANFLRTNTHEQHQLNLAALAALAEYQRACSALAQQGLQNGVAAGMGHLSPAAPPPASPASGRAHRQQQLLSQARQLLEAPPAAKNVAFLQTVALLTRVLSGGRVTMCKSGKDRTSMAVTLEHGALLQEHGMAPAQCARAVHTMRRRGVRRENVRLNTQRRLYAFNMVQRMALPEAYHPPEGSAAGGKG